MKVNLCRKNRKQPGVLPRLLNEVARPAAHSLDGDFDVGPCGHDDDWKLRIQRSHLRQKVETLLPRSRIAGVIQIDQQRVVRPIAQGIEHHLWRTGPVDTIALGPHQQLDRVQNMRLIVSHEQARRVRSTRQGGPQTLGLFSLDHALPLYTGSRFRASTSGFLSQTSFRCRLSYPDPVISNHKKQRRMHPSKAEPSTVSDATRRLTWRRQSRLPY